MPSSAPSETRTTTARPRERAVVDADDVASRRRSVVSRHGTSLSWWCEPRRGGSGGGPRESERSHSHTPRVVRATRRGPRRAAAAASSAPAQGRSRGLSAGAAPSTPHDELGQPRRRRVLVVARRARLDRSMMRRPSASKSCRTVVSGGRKCAASGMSSKPTMLTSPRHLEAGVADACTAPSAIWSLAQNTAVTSPRRRRARGRARVPGGGRPVAPQQRPRVEAEPLARVAPAALAVAPVHPGLGPRHVGDGSVAERGEVLDGELGAGGLVDRDGVVAVLGDAVGGDQGHRHPGGAQHVESLGVRRDQHDGGHRLADERVDGLLDGRGRRRRRGWPSTPGSRRGERRR